MVFDVVRLWCAHAICARPQPWRFFCAFLHRSFALKPCASVHDTSEVCSPPGATFQVSFAGPLATTLVSQRSSGGRGGRKAAAIGPNARSLQLERGVGSLEAKGGCRSSTRPSVSPASTRIARTRTCTRAACLWPCRMCTELPRRVRRRLA